jgi:DNA-directed RNA polymerase specialized sigma24 family protein
MDGYHRAMPQLHDSDEIRKLATVGAKARAVRAYFQEEQEMRILREEVIRALRADGASIAETAREVDCSIATVKTATRHGSGHGLVDG